MQSSGNDLCQEGVLGLVMLISVNESITEIWRSYLCNVTERLMLMAGLGVAFTLPWVNQFRNQHKYFVDYSEEQELYC